MVAHNHRQDLRGGRRFRRDGLPQHRRPAPRLDGLLAPRQPQEAGPGLPDRNNQFLIIQQLRQQFRDSGLPIVSVDTGGHRYKGARQLLILADSGGSNGCARRLWKTELQRALADPFGLAVTIAHYPTGASKWNPIEHRAFSEISKNWAGEPLVSYEKTLGFIRSTTTNTGLRVDAHLDRIVYPQGVEPTPQQLRDRQNAATRATSSASGCGWRAPVLT